MKRNWPNKDGKKLPRIEVIRDSLNRYLQEEQLKTYSQALNNQIELFCLGMGFQTLIHLTDIDLSHEQEHYLNGTLQTRRMAGIVCDLLALSEILPDKQELEYFKDLLDQKWKYCSQGLLEQSVIAEDAYANLVEYIQQGFHEFANLKTVLPEVAENQVYTNDIMFGATPFKLAIEKAAIRLIDPQHQGKKKVLLIISDGEFEEIPSSLITVDLLKRRGVVIATGIVGNKNVLSQLVKRFSHSHSQGTQLMLEIASKASDFNEEGIQWKEGKTTHTLKEEKLCFQINHSFLLENILEVVFTH